MKRAAILLVCLLLLLVGCGEEEERDSGPPPECFFVGRIIKVVDGRHGDAIFLCEEAGNNGLLEAGDLVWLETTPWYTDENGELFSLDEYVTGDRVEVDIRQIADLAPFGIAPIYNMRLLEKGDGTIANTDLYIRLGVEGIEAVGVGIQ